MTVKIRDGGAARDLSFLLRLFLLALCFAIGAVLGQVLASREAAGARDELVRYLTDFLTLSADLDISAKTFLSGAVLYFRYPALAFLLGFFSAGVVLLPVLAAVFGFFLSFSVSCLTAVFGGDGILLALAVMGVRCFITLPCFFFLSVTAFQRASSLIANPARQGKHLRAPRGVAPKWLGLTAALLLSGAVYELLVSPELVRLVLQRVLS